MNNDSGLLIKGIDVQEITKLVMKLYGGNKKPYHTYASKNDTIITLPVADDGNRELRIMEHDWGSETIGNNILTEKGDVHMYIEAFGKSKEIMLTIAYYYGGYFSESNLTDPVFLKIEKSNRKCIKSYFESTVSGKGNI